MIRSFNDCLFVLKNVECVKIIYFVPTKLVKSQNKFFETMWTVEFVQSIIRLFDIKNIVEKLCIIVYGLQNIIEYRLYNC